MTLLWSDEFDGAANTPPSPLYWRLSLFDEDDRDNSWSRNLANAHHDGNGNLKMVAIKEPSGTGRNYTAPRLVNQELDPAKRPTDGTPFFHKYGYWEVRMDVPQDVGIWPGAWTMGDFDATPGGWPECGEIDIVETINDAAVAHAHLHMPRNDGSGNDHDYGGSHPGPWGTGFHLYGVDWQPGSIKWYFDDVLVRSVTREQIESAGGTWVFDDQPQSPILTLAVGGSWAGTPDPSWTTSTMLVDYFRIYDSRPTTSDIELGSQTTIRQTTSSSTVVATKPVGTTVGDFLLVNFAVNTATVASAPAGWSLAYRNTSFNQKMYVYSKVADSSDVAAANWTWTLSAAAPNVGGLTRRFTNVDSGDVWASGESVAIDNANDTSWDVPAINGEEGQCVVGFATEDSASTTHTLTPPWIEDDDSGGTSTRSTVSFHQEMTVSGSTGIAAITIDAARTGKVAWMRMLRRAEVYDGFDELAAAEVEGVDYSRTAIRLSGASWSSIAIHGGGIEPGSGEMALAVGDRLMDTYVFAGIKSSGNADLRLTPQNFDEPTCVDLLAPSSKTLSFHGYTGTTGLAETAVSGLDDDLVRKVRIALTDAGFWVKDTPSEMSGTHPDNICNKNRNGAGVQIEMSWALRQSFFPDGNWSQAARESGARTPTFYDYVNAIRSVYPLPPGENVTSHIPLTVRLSTERASRHVTVDVRDLMMRWSDPGGYASCRVSLERPLSVQPDEIGYFGKLTVFDARNGLIVWDGRLEDPGRSARDGQVWELAALGGQAHTHDRTVPLIYVDQNLNNFRRVYDVTPAAQTGVGTAPVGTTLETAIVMQFPEGATVTPTSSVTMRYFNISNAGQRIGRVSVRVDSGRNISHFEPWLIVRTMGVDSSTWRNNPMSTTPVQYEMWVGDGVNGGSSVAHNACDFRIKCTVVGAVSDDNTWTAFYDWHVKATRYQANGHEITDYGLEDPYTVTASDVVKDLLGRLLTHFDGANAVIESDLEDYPFSQLAYPDGVTAHKVLTDLMLYDNTYTWRVWESTPVASGRLGIEDFIDTRYNFEFTGTWSREGGTYRSGVIGQGDTSDMVVTVPPGATTLQFEYRVDSELNKDFFKVYFDGIEKLSASGPSGLWTLSPVLNVAGVGRVTFRYAKDGDTNVGLDRAWIDEVNFAGVFTDRRHHRYRFEWVKRPTTVRYEADVVDGYESQGSSDGLYNQVTVRYRDAQGIAQMVTRTAACPDLDAVDLIRTGLLDLGTELGSAADAARIGDQWLAEHTVVHNAGTLRIARPILDLESGRMVQPWEIRPGLIRVRGILPRPDALNAGNRDGVTVFRIVAHEYSASDGVATLELDSAPSTIAQTLARLQLGAELPRR